MEDWIIAIIVVTLLLIIFNERVCEWLKQANDYLMSKKEGAKPLFESFKTPEGPHPREDEGKYMNMDLGEGQWIDYAKDIDVEPVVQMNHSDFVKNTRQFTSGANFTTIAGDHDNFTYNFQGLKRPTYVPIGASARQQPDVDESVLQRNNRRKISW